MNSRHFSRFRILKTAATLVLVSVIAAVSLSAGEHDAAIIAASKKYLKKESQVTDAAVKVEKVEGNYARVKVSPKDPSQTDPAWIFLKRERGAWRAVTLGTGFSPDYYKELGIPKSLQL
jgi:stress response protein SCP2